MDLLDRFRRTPPPPRPRRVVPAGPPPPEQVAALEELLDERAGPGFWTYDDTVEWAGDTVDDDPETFSGLDAAGARGVVDAWWRRRVDQEAGWDGEGDDVRLAAAFAELERAGITAQMNFACCQTCGHAEIGDAAADDARGYTFFHEQDSEQLAPGASSLYLAFGSFDPEGGVPAEERVAGEVVATLVAHGLVVEWDGTCQQRIHLPAVDWRQRLPPR